MKQTGVSRRMHAFDLSRRLDYQPSAGARFAAALTALFVLLGTIATHAIAAVPQRFGSNDVQRIVKLSSPQISPDGTHAIVIVSHINLEADTFEPELNWIDLHNHAMHPLTYARKGLAAAAFSPQGDRIAFLADAGASDDAKAQVFILRLDGGDARPVTSAPQGVTTFSWRPDGKAIAYTAADARPKLVAPAKFHDSFLVGNTPVTANDALRPLHLWLLPLGGGIAKELTHDPVRSATGDLAWSHDGKTLAFALSPDAALNEEAQARIVVLDSTTGTTRYLTAHRGNESDPLFSPDGTHVAYAHSAGDNQITLVQAYVTGIAGGAGTPVTASYDRAIRDFSWSPDGTGLYFICNNGTSTDFGRATRDGITTRINLGELQPSSALRGAIAPDGGFVFVGSTNESAPELYYRASDTAAPVAVTNVNAAISALTLGGSRIVPFKSDTGAVADAVLLTPPGFTPRKRYPLVLLVHGGPTSASTTAFNALGQLMTAHGWLVLEPNYRGSDDHGLAYQSAVRYDPEAGPGRDIDAALTAVRARGFVDPQRIAVSGWSYGGIMTAWMATHYRYWKVAVSGASVNDWSTDYSVADDADSDAALFHSGPWAGPAARAEYDRASAVTYAKDVTAPMLILSDVGDNRDPIATSYEFYHALKDNGKDVTFIAWPTPGHFPHDPVRVLDVYEHWIDYIAAHF